MEKEEAVMFPSINPYMSGGTAFFKKAWELEEKMRQDDKGYELLGDVINAYHIAFDKGDLDAGMNLLHLLANCIVNARIMGKTDITNSILKKTFRIVKRLESKGHAAGPYYRSLFLVFGVRNGKKIEEEEGGVITDEGVYEMNRQAILGNPYAREFVDTFENMKMRGMVLDDAETSGKVVRVMF